MIARIRDYVYRLWGALAIRSDRRNMARPGVSLGDFSKTLASTVATAEYTAGIARAVLDAMQPILEIQAALTEPDQVRTLLDLARSGERGQFVELACCLGVPADRVESLWQGTVRRLRPTGERRRPP